ncbi:hypothetical protein [Enhydrobacter sp.]|jgi:hypothetical protein|uniref:hypothetical protein n=1 Tax=Enhydrobacter sp. TaxID=1894999 RepID=UPI00261B9814|nr:hypothetical protein [Enhydrobacter sp.]
MPQFAWPAFTLERKDRHLVVIEVPADVSKEPVELVAFLIKGLLPEGGFALSSQGTAKGTRLFCAFASAVDAESMIDAVNAQENNLSFGWASEHHCAIDKATAKIIMGLVTSSSRGPETRSKRQGPPRMP